MFLDMSFSFSIVVTQNLSYKEVPPAPLGWPHLLIFITVHFYADFLFSVNPLGHIQPYSPHTDNYFSHSLPSRAGAALPARINKEQFSLELGLQKNNIGLSCAKTEGWSWS